jgi:hypothetical protein
MARGLFAPTLKNYQVISDERTAHAADHQLPTVIEVTPA